MNDEKKKKPQKPDDPFDLEQLRRKQTRIRVLNVDIEGARKMPHMIDPKTGKQLTDPEIFRKLYTTYYKKSKDMKVKKVITQHMELAPKYPCKYRYSYEGHLRCKATSQVKIIDTILRCAACKDITPPEIFEKKVQIKHKRVNVISQELTIRGFKAQHDYFTAIFEDGKYAWTCGAEVRQDPEGMLEFRCDKCPERVKTQSDSEGWHSGFACIGSRCKYLSVVDEEEIVKKALPLVIKGKGRGKHTKRPWDSELDRT